MIIKEEMRMGNWKQAEGSSYGSKKPWGRDVSQITCEVIEVLDKREWQSGKTELRIVRWNDAKPTIEKRNFKKSIDDQRNEGWQTGKAMGLNESDLKIIIQRQDEITRIMEKGSVKESTNNQQAQAPFRDTDEIPF